MLDIVDGSVPRMKLDRVEPTRQGDQPVHAVDPDADAFAGRVFASYETLTTLTMVGSILVCGEVADYVGIRPVAACGGSVVILSGLLWFILRRRDEEKR